MEKEVKRVNAVSYTHLFNMCSAGRDTFKILPNLEVYPCEYLTGNHKFLIGRCV